MIVQNFACLAIALATIPHLFSQPHAVSLCIVDTKPFAAGPYDPPAGPFATEMYRWLAGRALKDGSELNITVFPASLQWDILPEVQRLNCSWVLQLWYHRFADGNVFGQTPARGARFDTLSFTLWNGKTRKIIKSGGGFVSLREPMLTPYASLCKEILKALTQLRDQTARPATPSHAVVTAGTSGKPSTRRSR